jgi:hypothetical protein
MCNCKLQLSKVLSHWSQDPEAGNNDSGYPGKQQRTQVPTYEASARSYRTFSSVIYEFS